MGPGMDLSFMKGTMTLGGTPFTIGAAGGKDIVVLENRGALDPAYPAEVRMPVGRKAASLVFLHALTVPLPWSYAAQLKYAGTYFIEDEDGSRVDYPILYKRNILEYDALSPERRGGYKSQLVTLPGAAPAYKGATFVHWMNAGLVAVDNNLGWQTRGRDGGVLTVRFPAARKIAAVSLLGLPESPEYVFGPVSRMDYDIALSADGATWRKVAARTDYLPDRDWEGARVFDPVDVKAVRFAVKPGDPSRNSVCGLARIGIFAPK